MTCPCEPKIKQPKGCKGNTPPVLEVETHECPVLFHTVNIPASVGTVATLPPTPGAYRNARVTYEADQESYLYDSDGIPQLLSNGGSSAVLSVNGQTGAVVLSAEDVGAATPTDLANKQDVLTAGANITIDADNVISATDTTYSNFVGTDGVDAGSAGLVPAPATTDAGKFLKADGTWDDAGGGTLYTTYGQNEDGAMTQKATTDLVYTGGDPKKINIGDNGVAGATNSIVIGSEDSGTITGAADQIIIGHNVTDSGNDSIVIGHNTQGSTLGVRLGSCDNAYNQALGYASVSIGKNVRCQGSYSVSIGQETYVGSGGEAVAIGDQAAVASNGVAIGYAAGKTGNSYGNFIGSYASGGNYSASLGHQAKTGNNTYSVALGAYSLARDQGVVDVSTSTTTNGYKGTNDQTRTGYRVISGVHDGEQLNDAATVAQGNTLATSAPTTSTAGVLGQLYTDTTAMHTYQCTAIDTTDPDNPVYTWTQRW